MTAILAFVLTNWRWLLPAIIALALTATVGIQHVHIVELESAAAKTELAIEKQKTEAATMLAASEKHAREVEAKNAELAAQAQEKHDHDQADIDTRDRKITDLLAANGGLRVKAAGCGARGGDSVPSASAPAGLPAEPAGSLECRLPVDLSNAIHGDYRDAADIAAFGRACLAYALSLHKAAAAP